MLQCLLSDQLTIQLLKLQLVFGRDAILNLKFKADWKYSKQRKQEIINYNNKKENSKRIPHVYKENDKVMMSVKSTTKSKYGDNLTEALMKSSK